jgi:hypothetical protein
VKRSRTNKLYNYLVNTYGLSKENIMQHIEDRIEDIVRKHIDAKLDSEWFKNAILNYVAEFVENGVKDKHGLLYYQSKTPFEDLVYKEFQKAITDVMKENCEINLTFHGSEIFKRKPDETVS